MSISDIINWFIAYYTSKMPGNGRGRPQSATVSSTLEGYLKAPLEEFKCLRCFENVRIHLSNVNTGFGISMSKAPTLMTRSPWLSWRWSDIISLRHQAPPMLRGCFRMEAWWLLTTGQAFQEKNWTRSSFWGRMPWWQTSTLAGFEKDIWAQSLHIFSYCMTYKYIKNCVFNIGN